MFWLLVTQEREKLQNLRYEEKGVKVGVEGDMGKKEDICESNPN